MPEHSDNEKFMRRCIELSLQGKGHVAPNPMVGAVLVHNNLIIGEGFHQAYGKNHAEHNAIRSVARKELLQKSILYVNLEPCSHHGKTPPCVNLILEKQIPRVIIGTSDPNPLVAGRGARLLRENGVSVSLGVLENECKTLNKRFFTWHIRKRPYIILKWARSADGFIDLDRPPNAPIGPNWITSRTARTLVHRWRAEEQALLVGTNTVLKDDPKLNTRDWSGKNPLRVVIDRNLKLGNHHHIFDKSQETLIFTETIPPDAEQMATFTDDRIADMQMKKALNQMESAGLQSNPSDSKGKEASSEMNPIHSGRKTTAREKKVSDRFKTRYAAIIFDNTSELQMLEILYRNNIQSLIIEGGADTLNRFIEKGLWDEARVFTGSSLFRSGVKSPEITGQYMQSRMIGNSMLKVIYND